MRVSSSQPGSALLSKAQYNNHNHTGSLFTVSQIIIIIIIKFSKFIFFEKIYKVIKEIEYFTLNSFQSHLTQQSELFPLSSQKNLKNRFEKTKTKSRKGQGQGVIVGKGKRKKKKGCLWIRIEHHTCESCPLQHASLPFLYLLSPKPNHLQCAA